MNARARVESDPRDGQAAVTAPLTAVVGAMREELRALDGRLSAPHRVTVSGVEVRCGRLAGVPLLLACTGEGSQRASRGLETLLRSFPVARVVIVGVSGGLSPRLGPGSLLVARQVLDGDIAVPPPDPAWTDRALLVRGTREGVALTHERILGDPAAKAAAWAALPSSAPAAVDLESAAFARVAAAHQIPYIVVRAISDAADERLPFDLNRCRGREGQVLRSAVVRHALCHPQVIPGLWRLRGRVVRGSHKLADAVEELLGDLR